MSGAEQVEVEVYCTLILRSSGDVSFRLTDFAGGDVSACPSDDGSAPYFVHLKETLGVVSIAGHEFPRVSSVNWERPDEEDDGFGRARVQVPLRAFIEIVGTLRSGRWAVKGSEAPAVIVSQDPSDERRKDLARIHAQKRDLNLDDETYRAILKRVANVDSSKDLDAKGRRSVIAELARLGNRPQRPERPLHSQAPKTLEDRPLLTKIGALLAEQALPWAYAHGIAKQMFKRPVVQWCTDEQLRAVITALVKKEQRARRTEAQLGRGDGGDEPPKGA